MNGEPLLVSMIERLLEKQDLLIEKSIEHTHAIVEVNGCITEVNERLNILEKAKDARRKLDVETHKVWVPVVLKIIEVVALFIGAMLGISAVL